MTLQAIKYNKGTLEILDQLLLPVESRYIPINNTEDGWKAISTMQVRGAPAIAIVGCLSLAVELINCDGTKLTNKNSLLAYINSKLHYLVTARPTAVNMKQAAYKLSYVAESLNTDPSVDLTEMTSRFISQVEKMLVDDISDNKAIGKYGAEAILSRVKNENGDNKKICILTHCNTGSLATAGYGTALGVVRALNGTGNLEHVYFTETRPYNQGARLTGYELVYENIPATLVCDSAVSALMKMNSHPYNKKQNESVIKEYDATVESCAISAVVVGADRVTANGDTANKIGTYQIAVTALYHGVPFYVCAPLTTIDLNLPDGGHIVIEQRPEKEMTDINGKRIAAPGVSCWNPAFDVTPADLITGGIVTDKGVFKPDELAEKIQSLKLT